MELVPVSKGRFTIKNREGYSVEFAANDKGDVTELLFNSPDEKVKASKKK